VRPEEIATGRSYSSSSFSADFAVGCARLLVREARGAPSMGAIMTGVQRHRCGKITTAPSQTAKALDFANVER
jgi:hypothetical protein